MEPAAAFMLGVVVGTLFGFSVPIAEYMSRRRRQKTPEGTARRLVRAVSYTHLTLPTKA